ncbi:adenylate/guanylate cyclase domain-containing protein [Chitiniphilus purpureus]|uniref:Adenylate/guanylate cyclase domain-containing protein n=1 Tax=Chitiniphilus purpureus TaxID=2981137 RepID=A0ABY6DQQ4_9NEIS|nr:adenylate/guanylate cyclase domain-containing protein [Chitiniphilus sp. CD1]UXY16684.1 adenylate/guanylate cyclase domain-containing protein [Chitiniphilus sp. CD1]
MVGLKSDLDTEIATIFKSAWRVQKTETVPEPTDLVLNSNHAKDLEEATVLYADLDGSTSMVDSYSWEFSAEIYKSYLRCAGQIIRGEGGVITAYDGDRIMAIFTGDAKNSAAARCALRINYAVLFIIQPAIQAQYKQSPFILKHVVGIDTSPLRAARIGVRGENDIVWVGRAANHAAKLTSLSGAATWITASVYDRLNKESKFAGDVDMWTPMIWKSMGDMSIYASNYHWAFT